MQNLLKVFGLSVVGLGICAFGGNADAVQSSPRAAYNVRSGVSATGNTAQRMPSMPTLPIISVGNISTDVPTNNNGGGNNGGNNGGGEDPNPPKPDTGCPDGGVRNSDYTIDRCMNDVLACVNNGGLSNGLNDMFNEDLRNAIVNGMGLCQIQVERCVSEVRRDCANVYRSASDVWIDFNARKVQPEYYNFVLRKTGLTPNQAENTCRLLDKNTYGSSFTAVSNNGNVTAEYNNRVGAYNGQQGGVLIKSNPQGVQVNDNNPGVDGQRGHYARWDATTATCYLRVAAYNKDTHIKNSWLFGAAGDDQPAEVWRAAGDTFSCNKDLFGFSLMNNTSTVAVVGVGGGTVLGAGIGAIAGHGKRAFDCDNDKHREMLLEELKADGTIGKISEYMLLGDRISATAKDLTVSQCQDVVKLYDRYSQISSALRDCRDETVTEREETEILDLHFACNESSTEELQKCFEQNVKPCVGRSNVANCEAHLKAICGERTPSECYNALLGMGVSSSVMSLTKNVNDTTLHTCSFHPINLAKFYGDDIYCASGEDCAPITDIRADVKRLGDVFTKDIAELIRNGEKSNMGKSIGIGAAAGAGTGGLATAITAFVERSNINCRVGDNLAQVGMGKSYSIGSLKDFYVKWGLNLPDTVQPTQTASDCASWKRACGLLTDLNQCENAQLNYKAPNAVTTTLINTPCVVSGSACIENYPVAKSYGACE